MYKVFVYKLKPNKEQEARLSETLETCRRFYNHCLAERKDAWEQEKRSVRRIDQEKAIPSLRKDWSYLNDVALCVLRDTVRRVDRTFENFFQRMKKGEKTGYPRFKGRGWYDSFTYGQCGDHTYLKDNFLHLSKLGRYKIFSNLPLSGKPKTCTIVRKADGWYAHICCEVEPSPLPMTGEHTGIDVGIESFATLSDGESIPNPRHFKKAQKQLTKAQRRLSRRRKGSKRRGKAKLLLAKAHLKVKRARRDFAHKTARTLINRFDCIAVEKLNIKGMLKNHSLAKHVSDAGWGIFTQILRDKAESAGRVVVEVNPAGTSQTCSGCGESVPKRLSERWHTCPYCECSLHRDHNAALNIQKRGEGIAFGETLALAESENRELHSSD